MILYCIAGVSHVSRFNTVSYDTMTFMFQLQKPGRVARPGKNSKIKSLFFYGSVLELGQVLHEPPENPNLPAFLGSGLCDPTDIAGEPFCIEDFCFVNYQLIWSYSQKPLTFSSFTASNTYKRCFSTLYTICLILIELRMFYVIYFCL